MLINRARYGQNPNIRKPVFDSPNQIQTFLVRHDDVGHEDGDITSGQRCERRLAVIQSRYVKTGLNEHAFEQATNVIIVVNEANSLAGQGLLAERTLRFTPTI